MWFSQGDPGRRPAFSSLLPPGSCKLRGISPLHIRDHLGSLLRPLALSLRCRGRTCRCRRSRSREVAAHRHRRVRHAQVWTCTGPEWTAACAGDESSLGEELNQCASLFFSFFLGGMCRARDLISWWKGCGLGCGDFRSCALDEWGGIVGQARRERTPKNT